MKALYRSRLLVLFCISLINGVTPSFVSIDGYRGFRSSHETPMTYTYDRLDEARKQCSSVVGSSSEREPIDKSNRIYNLRQEFTFTSGDWRQDANGAPLMPFDNRNATSYNYSLPGNLSPMNLVSFWVTDIGRSHRSKGSVGVSGVLLMGVTVDGLFGMNPNDERDPQFRMWPRHSELPIAFQGIYAENGKERVLCLLGNTMLPSRYPDPANMWEWVKEPGYMNRPPLLQDDQILLVLRYPIPFTLTNRAILGSMKSLNPKSNQKYFDEVHIVSSLSNYEHYEFGSGSEKLVSRACTPYPYKDSFLASNGVDMYKGGDLCSIVQRFTSYGQEPLTIVPNWKCNVSDDFCIKLGPFESDSQIKATNGSFKDVKLVLQIVRCEELQSQGSAKVAAVLRVVPPFRDQYGTTQRSGLNNMTLFAEGMWEPSSGQLCMVGCLGIQGNQESTGCDSRICLYLPLSFSIRQRNIILGTISSISGTGNGSYFPLTFEKLVKPMELYDQYSSSHPYYEYSKIALAGAVLEKNEPFSFGNVIKKSFLTFPKVEGTESLFNSLNLLSEDLTLHTSAVPDPGFSYLPRKTDVQMEILSLGQLFGRYWSTSLNGSTVEDDAPYREKEKYTPKQLLLNVSAQLSLSGFSDKNFSTLFVEGIYYPLVGKMYLIGCRDIRASWSLLSGSLDLEAGLDCLIEVIISYPPTTSRWFANPTARVSVSSQRNEDDPFYFRPIKLQTFPFMYRSQREDILSRRGVEGIFRVLTLSLAIGFISSQLVYIKDNSDSLPYISLVMLSVQALGYSFPLITGAEALFQKSESYDGSSFVLERSQWIRVIDYTVKLLVLVSFLLTLRLFQKVWRSRMRLLTRAPLEPYRVPSDRRVLLFTSVVHVLGYACVLIIHSLNSKKKMLVQGSYGNPHRLPEWETELEEYVGLVQDFFLFPQVIANVLWQVDCKPLRKLYFVGITIVRLLPHIYDYVRSPIPNPYFSEEYEFVNPNLDFFSKFGDIAIPSTAVLFAIVIYVQQRWSYEKLSRALTFGKLKLLPSKSRAYERLPSVALESELASSEMTNGSA